jgi:hypothetical protein
MNESDRRKMERFDLKLPTMLFWTGKDKEQESIELMTDNVCAGGTYLKTNSPLPEGTEVKMNLTLQTDRLPGSRSRLSIVDVSGHVIRTEPHGMAICFNRNYKILPHYVTDS